MKNRAAATAATARGELQIAARDGHLAPEGAGIDADGVATRDPAKILSGAQLPFGGHKGSAIALMRAGTVEAAREAARLAVIDPETARRSVDTGIDRKLFDALGRLLTTVPETTTIHKTLARVLDGLALGEATARSLGLPLAPMRAALIGVLALATGTAVAQAGLIGFVGLAAPHLVRGMARVTHGPLVLLSAVTGGLLLALADVIARVVIAPQELPGGVLTAVLGGSYLLWLMYRRTR